MRDRAYDFLGGVWESTAFDELNAEWSTCMANAGYRESSPSAAQDAWWQAAAGELSQESVGAAGAASSEDRAGRVALVAATG